MPITFIMLMLAIISTWIPSFKYKNISVPPWIALLTISIGLGLLNKQLGLISLLSIITFAILVKNNAKQKNTLLCLLTTSLALALALHVMPGFYNPKLYSALQVSNHAPPFTLYANFDKGVAGLLLLAFATQKITSRHELSQVLKTTFITCVSAIICVFGLGLLSNYIKWDYKFNQFTFDFLCVNLFFTCIAEELFFRTLIQTKIAAMFAKQQQGKTIAIILSALLFGIAHLAGGVYTMIFASITGLFTAYVYAQTEKVETAIFCHFIINAVHVICFTYPYLQQKI